MSFRLDLETIAPSTVSVNNHFVLTNNANPVKVTLQLSIARPAESILRLRSRTFATHASAPWELHEPQRLHDLGMRQPRLGRLIAIQRHRLYGVHHNLTLSLDVGE